MRHHNPYIAPQCKALCLDEERFLCTSGNTPQQNLKVNNSTPMTTGFGDSNRRENDNEIW